MTPKRKPAHPAARFAAPRLGLVCVSHCRTLSYRTITRTRFLALPDAGKREKLGEIYAANVAGVYRALDFCHGRGISLYRVTSALFPQVDHPIGREVLESLATELSGVGPRATDLGIRVVIHPDQYVVINSDTPAVVDNSLLILDLHARAMDFMGLDRSPWAALILHGGKSDRADTLVGRIAKLPENVRSRLCLENDEYAYSAREILDICRRSDVPMIFDNLHHAIKDQVDSYDDPSVAHFTREAATTWPDPAWQIVHLSNGAAAFRDRNHSDHITDWPTAYDTVPWVEVEARGKEQAIARLAKRLATRRRHSTDRG